MKIIPSSRREILRCMIWVLILSSLSFLYFSELKETAQEIRGRFALHTVKFKSPTLSAFLKRTVKMRAAIVMPEMKDINQSETLPVMYHLPGFGTSLRDNWHTADLLKRLMDDKDAFRMIHIFIDVNLDGGYHYFTNSQNNGPWDDALIKEFIPFLDQAAGPQIIISKRFLSGHSSGGWTALWLQIRHPEIFSGVWATSPDPADFSDFFGIDIRPGSKDNFYTQPDGNLRPAARTDVLQFDTLKEYIADNEEDDERGDIASYEWAFSPRGKKGKPMRLFNRKNGNLNQKALKAWQKYNLSSLVATLPADKKLLLQNKIHIFCGNDDDFFLERPTKLFCSKLSELNIAHSCAIVEHRDHHTLYLPHANYPHGLLFRILQEAQ